jgi:hypothetical protein
LDILSIHGFCFEDLAGNVLALFGIFDRFLFGLSHFSLLHRSWILSSSLFPETRTTKERTLQNQTEKTCQTQVTTTKKSNIHFFKEVFPNASGATQCFDLSHIYFSSKLSFANNVFSKTTKKRNNQLTIATIATTSRIPPHTDPTTTPMKTPIGSPAIMPEEPCA